MTRVSTIDPRLFKIVDSTLWIPDSRYLIPDILLLVKLEFRFQKPMIPASIKRDNNFSSCGWWGEEG